MAAFRYPRTSQPQSPVGIDWGNPLTKGLRLAWNAALPLNNAADPGNMPTYTGSRSVGIRKDGLREQGLNGASHYVSWTPPSGLTAASIFQLMQLNTSAIGTANPPWDTNTGSIDYIPFSNSLVYSGAFATARYINGVAVPGGTGSLTGRAFSFAASGKTGNHATYKDGAVVGSSAAGVFSLRSTIRIGVEFAGADLDGGIYLTLFWDRVLSAQEHAALSANPWQIFTPQSRQIWVPTSGGANTYTITPSGAITLTGVAETSRTRVQSSSGTVSFSGSAPFSQNNTYTFSISGAIGFSGTDSFLKTRTQVPTGEIAFSGTSILLKTRGFSPSGAITFSGEASKLYTRAFVPTGQLSFYGTAPLIDPNAPTGVSTWRTLTGSGN